MMRLFWKVGAGTGLRWRNTSLTVHELPQTETEQSQRSEIQHGGHGQQAQPHAQPQQVAMRPVPRQGDGAPQHHPAQRQLCQSHLERIPPPARLRLKHAASAQPAKQQAGIEQRAHGDGQRQPGMPQPRHEQQVHQLGAHQHHQGDFHRGAQVLPGVEAGGENLDADQRDQADAISPQCARRGQHIRMVEAAVVVKHRYQRLGEDQQRDGAGQRQHQGEAQPPVEQGAVLGHVLRGAGARQAGQQHRAQRHAENGGGEFHQPVRIRQPGHAARMQVRRDLRVDDNGHLRHRNRQARGQHLLDHAVHALRSPGLEKAQPKAWHHGVLAQRRPLHRQLRHPADHHPDRQGENGRMHQFVKRHCGADDRQVEQRRGDRGHREVLPGIENACAERHQRNQPRVGKHQPSHPDGRVKRFGMQAGRCEPHQHWRE